MTSPLASVIIVNWNGKHFLDQCLQSVMNQSCRDFEIILVDNGSSDGSVDFVRENYSSVHLIPLKRNYGFCIGNNIGFQHSSSQAKYLVTLNNDTKVQSIWLEKLIDIAEKDDQIGMVASKMIYFHNDQQMIDSIGLRIERNGLGKNIGNGEIDRGQYDELDSPFAPCAGAALYKKQMIEEVGMFDKKYFAYYEDVDLGWRGRLGGWKSKTAPDVVVYHHHSGSKFSQKPFFLHRNKLFTIIKNFPYSLLIKYFPEIASYDLLASIYSILSENNLLTIQAKLAILKELPELIHQRRTIQKNRKVSLDTVESWFSETESVTQFVQRKLKTKKSKTNEDTLSE